MYGNRGGRGPKWLRKGDSGSRYDGEERDDIDRPKSSRSGGGGSSRRGHGGGRGHRGGRGHPPWLRGKEIGLFYRHLAWKKKEEQAEKVEKQRIRLDPNCEDEIMTLLRSAEKKWCSEDVKDVPSSQDLEQRYDTLGESRFKHQFLQSVTGSLEEKLSQAVRTGVGKGLRRDPELDEKLRLQLESRIEADSPLLKFRKLLPAYKMRREIVDLVTANQVVVLSGETGCGKTTQVAQFLLDEEIAAGRGSACCIITTQPRRISAISVAQRVAEERGESCGGPDASCGYQIRLESALPRRRGSITFCTTGVLLQWMHSDPALSAVSHLILDEVHERDIICDFAMAILKNILSVRSDLKLILMSATLNAESFSHYFGDCPCINIPGFTYPVEELYLEDVLQLTGFQLPPPRREPQTWKRHLKKFKDKTQQHIEYNDFIAPYIRNLEAEGKYSRSVLQMLKSMDCEELNLELICELLKYICKTRSDGAILVFLPGWDNISSLNRIMEQSGCFPPYKYRVIPLHSLMPTTMQKTVFERPPLGMRKIVISTNIAETSVTIDDVVFVVDCGKIKMKNFDLEKNLSTLQPEWVSQSNARQRRGRAGRVQPGVCYHLFTRAREAILQQYPLPEMLRSRLEEVILQIKILQLGRAAPFLERVMDPPDPRVVHLSLDLLQSLGALDADENLTPLGFHLAKLPMDPQTGKMILMAAIFSCVDPVFSVAASLSFKDAFVTPLGRERDVDAVKKELAEGWCSDHLLLAFALRHWETAGSHRASFCRDHFLSYNTLSLLADMKKQFAQHLYDMNFMSLPDPKDKAANINSENLGLVKAIICAGLYPNVAIVKKVRKSKRASKVSVVAFTPEDGKVRLHPKSVNEQCSKFISPLLVYHQKMRSTDVYLHDTTMVAPLPIVFFGCGVRFEAHDENGDGVLLLPGDVRYACHRNTADVIQRLRHVLDQLLAHKVSHPGPVSWDDTSMEESLLRAIVCLISFEEEEMFTVTEETCDSEDDDNSRYYK